MSTEQRQVQNELQGQLRSKATEVKEVDSKYRLKYNQLKQLVSEYRLQTDRYKQIIKNQQKQISLQSQFKADAGADIDSQTLVEYAEPKIDNWVRNNQV